METKLQGYASWSSLAKKVKIGIISAMLAGGAMMTIGQASSVSADEVNQAGGAVRYPTDAEIYANAQKVDLSKRVLTGSSLYGIVSQNLSFRYPSDTPSVGKK
ncbi:hypothetical protein [Streptococcus catagoni]|uniref:hypothetical protein n=1 Tax=Streptococcus catagoni TaxID=2654874 RepID=UPI00140E3B5B|nr:hypothetical protein [Streptococcus catagoni]